MMTEAEKASATTRWREACRWARERWGDRVTVVNYKSRGVFVASLDGPPNRGDNRRFWLNNGVFEELSPSEGVNATSGALRSEEQRAGRAAAKARR